MSLRPIDLDKIDPTKLDFSLDIRDLSRELIFTVKINDDKVFSQLSVEAESLFKDAMTEFKQIQQDFKNQKP